MRKPIVIFFVLLFAMIWIACTNESEQSAKQPEQTQEVHNDSNGACSKPTIIMDPNNAKPMALMMRQMVVNMDKMKAKLIAVERVSEKDFPFLRFYLVEPTDPNVLEPKFYENARLFQEAYKQIFETKGLQAKAYNAAISKCINCHQSYCSGPIKRIKKLVIN
jgi:hypothetical protein